MRLRFWEFGECDVDLSISVLGMFVWGFGMVQPGGEVVGQSLQTFRRSRSSSGIHGQYTHIRLCAGRCPSLTAGGGIGRHHRRMVVQLLGWSEKWHQISEGWDGAVGKQHQARVGVCCVCRTRSSIRSSCARDDAETRIGRLGRREALLVVLDSTLW